VERRQSSTDAKKSQLLAHGVQGGFTPEVQKELTSHRDVALDIARRLLEDNSPESMHDDILQAVGTDLTSPAAANRTRDSSFRHRLLRAYQYRCAVCGFDLRLGNVAVGLEAAHIKWHQAGGAGRAGSPHHGRPAEGSFKAQYHSVKDKDGVRRAMVTVKGEEFLISLEEITRAPTSDELRFSWNARKRYYEVVPTGATVATDRCTCFRWPSEERHPAFPF